MNWSHFQRFRVMLHPFHQIEKLKNGYRRAKCKYVNFMKSRVKKIFGCRSNTLLQNTLNSVYLSIPTDCRVRLGDQPYPKMSISGAEGVLKLQSLFPCK